MIETLVETKEMIAFFKRDIGLHLYAIGDLEEPYRSRSTFWGWREEGGLRAVVLLYQGEEGTTVLALNREEEAAWMRALIGGLGDRLPGSFYGHLSSAAMAALGEGGWKIQPEGKLWKMRLEERQALEDIPVSEGIAIPSVEDAESVEALYEASYPGHWFTRGRLKEGWMRGIREGGSWLALAGVHVVSPAVGVAALGDITVAKEVRGRGLGRKVVAALCRALQEAGITEIGLNVDQSNVAAIRSYEALGFRRIAWYEEAYISRAVSGG